MNPSENPPPPSEQLKSDAELQAQKSLCNSLNRVEIDETDTEEDEKYILFEYRLIVQQEMHLLLNDQGLKVYIRKPKQRKALLLELSQIPETLRWMDLNLEDFSSIILGNNKIQIIGNLLLIPIDFGGIKKSFKMEIKQRGLSYRELYLLETNISNNLKKLVQDCFCLRKDLYLVCRVCEVYMNKKNTVINSNVFINAFQNKPANAIANQTSSNSPFNGSTPLLNSSQGLRNNNVGLGNFPFAPQQNPNACPKCNMIMESLLLV